MGLIADWLRNLIGGELSLRRRIALAADNYRRRVTERQACCGHPGEPGC